MGSCGVPKPVRALDIHDVDAGLFIRVRRGGVAVFGVDGDVAVAVDGDFGAAVAEVPGFFAVGRAKRAH